MNIISVQGRYAPPYYLNITNKDYLKQLIKSVTGRDPIIISSKFQTDIIYFDKIDRNEQLLQIWSKVVGSEFQSSDLIKFFRSCDEKLSLENFLYRVYRLRRFKKWYDRYYEALVEVMNENAGHELCQRISLRLEELQIPVELEGGNICIQKLDAYISFKELASQVQSGN